MWTPNTRFYAVFVPANDHLAFIDPRSAIVAPVAATQSAEFMVWFEGNRLGADNLHRYVERVHCAAGRADTRYPTTAIAQAQLAQLRQVGTYDFLLGRLTVADEDALKAWLDGERLDCDLDTSAAQTAEVMRLMPKAMHEALLDAGGDALHRLRVKSYLDASA